ncbi:nitrate/nitrite transporter [Acidobacterium sp. S8]|uniref:MFS transporter n=1 Tax=Acidobacterium sp. S8 TaxID=1641854 RepID=UPI0020B1437D|nr:hypothetical protein [Acidobacterium sp. S8]
MAPTVVHGKVLVGDSGGEFGVRGWLAALDANSGKLIWQAYKTGPDKDVLIGDRFKPFYASDKGTDLGVKTWPPDAWRVGGFLGLATFLPSFFYSQFHVSKVQAGSLTVLATLTGSLTRILGGWFADRIGGITTLSVVFLLAIAGLFGLMSTPSLILTTLLFMLCFAALGAGNGATFQLVPLRWPLTTAVAGGMIGEIGALGGGILPNLLGQSKQHTGSYRSGLLLYAMLAVAVLVMMRIAARSWTRAWVGSGGRVNGELSAFHSEMVPSEKSVMEIAT